MSAFAMPMLIVNMGGEMVYILAQRLQAQNVPLDKSKRVLQDVIRTMYNPMFIQELFRPQDVYSMQSTRQIFDRLAHSSIMRLNESSMDKVRAGGPALSSLLLLGPECFAAPPTPTKTPPPNASLTPPLPVAHSSVVSAPFLSLCLSVAPRPPCPAL